VRRPWPAPVPPVRTLSIHDQLPVMAGKNPFRTTLVAPCGMDCAICMAFLREKNRCGGCYSANCSCRRHCTIAACEHIRGRYRHGCGSFPCRRLKQLDKRYRAKYRMSMLDNLAPSGSMGSAHS